MTTRVIVIDGEAVIGFNQKRLEELLASQKNLDKELFGWYVFSKLKAPKCIRLKTGNLLNLPSVVYVITRRKYEQIEIVSDVFYLHAWSYRVAF